MGVPYTLKVTIGIYDYLKHGSIFRLTGMSIEEDMEGPGSIRLEDYVCQIQ